MGYQPQGQVFTELLDQAEQKVFQIAEQTSRGQGPQLIRSSAAEVLKQLDELYHNPSAVTGLSTGFLDLDKLTSGLQPADLVIVAGRPSMGKTMLGINIAEYVALDTRKPVLIFSMEMPKNAITQRMLSSLGRIDQQVVRNGQWRKEDWPHIGDTMNLIANAPIFIDDTPALTPGELRSRARRVVREQKDLKLIVVDYLQLMRVSNEPETRAAEVSEISRSLKALAKELNVPIIALSQLNRGLEQRTDKRPMMSDLRESGSLEQDADLIIFIYRDEVYNPNTDAKNIAEIILAKHRNGPIGKIKLNFSGHYVRFDNLARRYATESIEL